MPNKTLASSNALKTGAYARDGLLPWEDPEDYQELVMQTVSDLQPWGALETEIALNVAENRWLRRRLQRTTAIATHRHTFGQKLEESGAKSWSDALKVVRTHHLERHKALEDLAKSNHEFAQVAARWSKPEKLEELAEKVASRCELTFDVLTRVEAGLDEQHDFFREYSGKQLDRRVKLENALDAQFDKLIARLINLQEARLLREKLKKQPAAGVSGGVGSHDNVDQGSKSHELPSRQGEQQLDLAELDRDDVDEDAEVVKGPSGNRAAPKVSRKDDTVDPLAEFLREGGEASDEAKPDQVDDDTDDWGEPKEPKA